MIALLVNAPSDRQSWLAATILALMALAIAANTLMLFSHEVPADEANVNKLRLEHLGRGFILSGEYGSRCRRNHPAPASQSGHGSTR
jgi:nitrate/nitrite transporter NarK